MEPGIQDISEDLLQAISSTSQVQNPAPQVQDWPPALLAPPQKKKGMTPTWADLRGVLGLQCTTICPQRCGADGASHWSSVSLCEIRKRTVTLWCGWQAEQKEWRKQNCGWNPTGQSRWPLRTAPSMDPGPCSPLSSCSPGHCIPLLPTGDLAPKHDHRAQWTPGTRP